MFPSFITPGTWAITGLSCRRTCGTCRRRRACPSSACSIINVACVITSACAKLFTQSIGIGIWTSPTFGIVINTRPNPIDTMPNLDRATGNVRRTTTAAPFGGAGWVGGRGGGSVGCQWGGRFGESSCSTPCGDSRRKRDLADSVCIIKSQQGFGYPPQFA